jgi:predicted PurR-regulated permease PerM
MGESSSQAPTRASVTVAGLKLISVAIILTFVYLASSVVITLICSIFIAFVLEPGVRLLERLRVPRWLGSLVMVLLMMAALYVAVYAVYDRATAFVNDLPKLLAKLRQLFAHVQIIARNIQQTTDILPSSTDASLPTVRLAQESPWMQFLLGGIRSVYAFVLTVMFVPFLVFFMLTSRDQIWQSTLNLFSAERRQQAENVIYSISVMVRRFVVGNFLVAVISAGLIIPVFAAIQLRYALLMGCLAALLSLIPYIGVALALLPPLLIAVVDYNTVEPFLTIAATVVLVHFLAVNILTPKLVGQRVKLNALSVTIAMMFWGWLWGGIGLVLAIPLTAAIKVVCDNVERLRPFGAWLGEE